MSFKHKNFFTTNVSFFLISFGVFQREMYKWGIAENLSFEVIAEISSYGPICGVT